MWHPTLLLLLLSNNAVLTILGDQTTPFVASHHQLHQSQPSSSLVLAFDNDRLAAATLTMLISLIQLNLLVLFG